MKPLPLKYSSWAEFYNDIANLAIHHESIMVSQKRVRTKMDSEIIENEDLIYDLQEIKSKAFEEIMECKLEPRTANIIKQYLSAINTVSLLEIDKANNLITLLTKNK